jgi:hypothetical protein
MRKIMAILKSYEPVPITIGIMLRQIKCRTGFEGFKDRQDDTDFAKKS